MNELNGVLCLIFEEVGVDTISFVPCFECARIIAFTIQSITVPQPCLFRHFGHAARGAQLAYVQAVGVEVAGKGVQVNAIAQNFVDNPTYFPPEVQADPRFRERLAREVPLGRLVAADEDAEFAAYLCSDAANCFVGQVFPVCGGWVQR